MGNPIKDIDIDAVINVLDKLVGTETSTGNSRNYTIQSIVDLITASSSSIINSKIITIQETVAGNFLDVINADVSGHVFNVGDVGFVVVNDTGAAYKATYHLIKTSTTVSRTYGLGELQMVSGDLLLIRSVSDAGEVNTNSSLGGAESLVGTKVGVDLPIKGLDAGTNMSVTSTGTAVTYNMTGTLGEINTASNAGSGESLYSGKTASDIELKSITAVGAPVSSTATDISIDIWSNVEKTAGFTLADSDTNTTMWCTNATTMTIVVPAGLAQTNNFAFVRRGVGAVNFDFTAVTNPAANTLISAQHGTAWLEMSPATSEEYGFWGDVGV